MPRPLDSQLCCSAALTIGMLRSGLSRRHHGRVGGLLLIHRGEGRDEEWSCEEQWSRGQGREQIQRAALEHDGKRCA